MSTQTTPARPFYFGIAVWGKEYCQNFLSNTLASLLAPGNIPALPKHEDSKLLFYTTTEDWHWLQNQPLFIEASKHLQPELVPIQLVNASDYKDEEKLALKFHIVNKAHHDMVDRMYQDQAIGSVIYPDTIYSENSLQSILKYLSQPTTKAVLSHVPRLCTPEFLASLQRAGLTQPNEITQINSRTLATHALANMNTEMLAQRWDHLYAFDFITDIWLPLHEAPTTGIVAHSFAWCPIFINYSKLDQHNIECLENNTIDGSYLYNNLKYDELHLITDSDEFLMVSFSPHTKLRVSKKFSTSSPGADTQVKINHWRKMIQLARGGFVDDLKLKLLETPAYTHIHDLTAQDKQLIKQTTRIIKSVLGKPGITEKIFWRVISSQRVKKLTKKWLKSKPASSYTHTDEVIKQHTI